MDSKIKRIRDYRAEHNCGLKEARRAIAMEDAGLPPGEWSGNVTDAVQHAEDKIRLAKAVYEQAINDGISTVYFALEGECPEIGPREGMQVARRLLKQKLLPSD